MDCWAVCTCVCECDPVLRLVSGRDVRVHHHDLVSVSGRVDLHLRVVVVDLDVVLHLADASRVRV